MYRGVTVGDFRADFLVEDKVIVEVKAVERLTTAHDGQILNYLKASRREVGLLLNFGPRSERRRFIWTARGRQVDTLDTVAGAAPATPATA